MIKRVRQHVGRWMRRDPRDAAADALLFADHEEIQDIARQIRRTKVEMDRSVLSMRSWARDLGRRLAEAPRGLSRNEDLRALGETVGGLAHNFNNSLAAILAYTELMLRERESEAAGGWDVEVADAGWRMAAEPRGRLAAQPRSLHPGQGQGRGPPEFYDIAERHGVGLTIASGSGRGTGVRLGLPASGFQIIPAS